MSRFHSYLNSAEKILSSYQGNEPFVSFVKKFFAANKKYGSKDRKQISHCCYCYFRLGKALGDLPLKEKIAAGLFVCSSQPGVMLAEINTEWNEQVHHSLKDKLTLIGSGLPDVFPWMDELSATIDPEKFSSSFFEQPDLFLRIRPGHTKKVLKQLEDASVAYELIGDASLRLPPGFNAENHFELNKEVLVQDLNSQRIGELLMARTERSGKSSGKVWDCCAASGGKSIMAYDIDPSIELTVSDVRKSILVNLKKRFEQAGIRKYKSFVTDLSDPPSTSDHSPFDLIIADVPCTGSGTWSRTPEQLAFFDAGNIEKYAALQKKIVSTIIPHLKAGGHLLYSTCSVFKRENEEMVSYLKEKFHLKLMKMELLKGYELKADTLFAALLQKL